MKVLLVLAGLVATSLAWNTGGGWNQGYMGNGGGYNQGNMGNGGGYNQGNIGNGGNNMLAALLTGLLSRNAGNQGGVAQWGGNNRQSSGGLTELLLLQLLHSMGQKKDSESEDSDSGSDDFKDHEAELKKYMKKKLVKELAKEVALHLTLMKKKASFELAIHAICNFKEVAGDSFSGFMTEADWDKFKDEDWDKSDLPERMTALKTEDPNKFIEGGLKIAGWVCDSGIELDELLKQMEDEGDDMGDGDKGGEDEGRD